MARFWGCRKPKFVRNYGAAYFPVDAAAPRYYVSIPDKKERTHMEKRLRSPNYPALSLPEAVEKITAIYSKLHHHAGPRDVMARAMGFSTLNGASATAISALHKYGLLEKDGEDNKVSERALRILHPHSLLERSEAIREAATAPVLFQELAERFPGRTPNDDLLRNYLVRKGFAPAALSAVIAAYRETSEMARLEDGGQDVSTDHPPEDVPTMNSPSTMHLGRVPSVGPAPAVLANERLIGRYDFEGGSGVRITAIGEIDTEAALDMIETLVGLKRKELERANKQVNPSSRALVVVPEDKFGGL